MHRRRRVISGAAADTDSMTTPADPCRRAGGERGSMDPVSSTVEVRKDETTRLFEAVVDGKVVGTLAYETTGGRVALTHSFVDEEQRNHGIASALSHYALKDLSGGEGKVGIYCGFVADYVQKHPEWESVADIGRSAFIATRTARDTNGGR